MNKHNTAWLSCQGKLCWEWCLILYSLCCSCDKLIIASSVQCYFAYSALVSAGKAKGWLTDQPSVAASLFFSSGYLFCSALRDTRQKSGSGGDKGHCPNVKHLLSKALRNVKVKSRFRYVLENPHFNSKISNISVPEGLEILFFTKFLLLLPYSWYLFLRLLSCTVHVTLNFCLYSAFTIQIPLLLAVFSVVVRTLKVTW